MVATMAIHSALSCPRICSDWKSDAGGLPYENGLEVLLCGCNLFLLFLIGAGSRPNAGIL